MRTLYLDSFAGIAGDMFTAAFLDAGIVDPDDIRAVPGLVGLPEVSVEISEVQRASARFTTVRVLLPDRAPEHDHHLVTDHGGHEGHHSGADHHHHHGAEHDHHGHHGHGHEGGHHHHHYSTLVHRLGESDLDPVAKELALRVFRLLAEAEAESHGVPVEDVIFHEVGAADSVVDVAMAGVCIATVAPDRVLASPVKLGRGTIEIQHGTYPVPPPATARLAVGMPVSPVPEAITRPNVELSTPTGMAILKALDPTFSQEWPAGTLVAQGAGAGTMDLGDYPNVFRVGLFRESESATAATGRTNESLAGSLPYNSDRVYELRCNVDDQTGERTAWLMERGLGMGAVDGWVTPILGKKGRPAACMTFLVHADHLLALSDFLLRESSSFGVRYSPWDRLMLAREEEVRSTPDGPVSFKIGRTTSGELIKEKPEFEDLKKIWDAPGES